MLGGNAVMDKHPIQREVKIQLKLCKQPPLYNGHLFTTATFVGPGMDYTFTLILTYL